MAASNSQSKTISDHISKLRALVDKKVSLCSDFYNAPSLSSHTACFNNDPYMHILQLYTQHSCTYVTCTCTQCTYCTSHVHVHSCTHTCLYDEHTLHHSFIQLHYFCQISLNPPFSCTQSTPSSELLSHLPPLFELLTARVDYLFCRATTLQGSRVGGSSGIVTSTSSVRPIGSMNVTKSIME